MCSNDRKTRKLFLKTNDVSAVDRTIIKMTTFKCIENLEENTVEVFLEVASLLLRIVDNVLLYPSNPKYRKLRLDNKLLTTVIMPSIGAMECLFEIGFQENDDSLFLPPENTSLDKLKRFRTEISEKRENYLKQKDSAVNGNVKAGSKMDSGRQSSPQPEAAASLVKPQPPPPHHSVNFANSFIARLYNVSDTVLQYEKETTKQKVRSVVPLEKIGEKVQERMRQHQKLALKDGQTVNETSMQESFFLLELMNWFKHEFFEWVNSPKCTDCNNCDTKFLEMSSNSQAERVEVYKCGQCSARVLFPRINEVDRLLESRRGRCGEWANTFTAICHTLGWDARYVYDETDHVWTEVYLNSEARWVHCDPCECALDKPLLYERGWGKKLTYVIAFSWEDVQDVTWRYTTDHRAVLARRRLCAEPQLVQAICELNKRRQANLSAARKKLLARRTVTELVQLMVSPVEQEGEEQGRQSGSLGWRLARHETTLAQAGTSYQWKPTVQEMSAKRLVIRYCTASDQYSRGVEGETLKGWRTGVYSADCVFRKEETDWKTVYLCRTEGSTEGKVSWRLDTADSGLRVDQVTVRCASTTYETASVTWLLCSGEKCLRITNGQLRTCEFRGSSCITLSASLKGGKSDVAWQHAQLFRQAINASEPLLELSVTLIDAE